MNADRPSHSSACGFSLIEIVIGLVVLSFLGIVGVNMISGSVSTNQVISNAQLAYSSARYALDRISREIREIKYDVSTNTIGITSASNMTASKLVFTQTGANSSSKLVTLTYTPPNASVPGYILLTYDSNQSSMIANNLSNPIGIFSYIQDDGSTSASDPSTLRYVRIDLSVKPDSTKNQVLALSNLVVIRNK